MQQTGTPMDWFSSPQHDAGIMTAWEHRVGGGEWQSSEVRGVVDDSWRRCLVGQVNPTADRAPPPLGEDQLMQWQSASNRLISASLPLMQQIHELLTQTDTVMLLADSDGMVFAEAFGARLTAPAHGPAFHKGHLVIRPESMRFLEHPAEAENRFEGMLYNEYALGSRVQYQVRVGEHVFMVERLRQQAFAGRLDERVLIGWNAVDSILVAD